MISIVPYCMDVIPYGRDLISRVPYGRELAQGPELMSLLMSESGQNVSSAFNWKNREGISCITSPKQNRIFIVQDTDTAYTSNSRNFDEIFLQQVRERLPTGVQLIKGELSYPTSNVPHEYKMAWEQCVQGIHH